MRNQTLATPPASLLAQNLGLIAHALGDLWELWSRLRAGCDGSTAGDLAEAARAAAEAVNTLSGRIAQLVAELPHRNADSDDLDGDSEPLVLLRASLECVLQDQLSPALRSLLEVADITLGSEPELVRATLRCTLTDGLSPALAGLTSILAAETGSW